MFCYPVLSKGSLPTNVILRTRPPLEMAPLTNPTTREEARVPPVSQGARRSTRTPRPKDVASPAQKLTVKFSLA